LFSLGIIASSISADITPYVLSSSDTSRVAVDSNGNYYFTEMNVGGGTSTLFKFTSTGNQLWAKEINYEMRRVFVDNNDNVILLQRLQERICKVDSSGNLVFDITFGAAVDIYDVTVDSSDNYIFAGIDTAPTDDLGVVIKTNSSGVIQWQRTFEIDDPDFDKSEAYGVITDDSDNVFVTGDIKLDGVASEGVILKFNSSGTLQAQESYDIPRELSFAGSRFSFFDGSLFISNEDNRTFKVDPSTLAISTAVSGLSGVTNDGIYGYGFYKSGVDYTFIRFNSSLVPDLALEGNLGNAVTSGPSPSIELVGNSLVGGSNTKIAVVAKTLDSVGTAAGVTFATATPSLSPVTIEAGEYTVTTNVSSYATADAGITLTASTAIITKDVIE